MQELRQSTAVTLKIGPFLDSTDGVTAETALTITAAEVLLSKNGGAFTLKTEATACTHDTGGWYGCPIDATDTGTLGRLQLSVQEAGALPVWHEYMVVPANVWDSLFGSDYLKTDVTQAGGSAIQQASGYLKVKDDEGNTLANESKQDIIDTVVDAIKAVTDLLPNAGALSDLAAILTDTGTTLPATLATIAGYIDAEVASILAAVDTEVAAIKAKTDLLPSGVEKGVEWETAFLMVDETDFATPETGKTVTVQISKDGGAFANCDNTPATEISAGLYKITLTATEMNAALIILKATGDGCAQRTLLIVTS